MLLGSDPGGQDCGQRGTLVSGCKEDVRTATWKKQLGAVIATNGAVRCGGEMRLLILPLDALQITYFCTYLGLLTRKASGIACSDNPRRSSSLLEKQRRIQNIDIRLQPAANEVQSRVANPMESWKCPR